MALLSETYRSFYPQPEAPAPLPPPPAPTEGLVRPPTRLPIRQLLMVLLIGVLAIILIDSLLNKPVAPGSV
jgi:hypothetical protein